MSAGGPPVRLHDRTAGLRVVAEVPLGWTAMPLARPDLTRAEEIQVLAWEAWAPAVAADRPPSRASLVTACFAGETRWWTPEAEPAVLERLGAAVSSTALRVAGVGARRVVSTTHECFAATERIEGAGDDEGELVARTFLGFVDSETLVGCFALCTTDLGACRPSVDAATVRADFVPAPPPTLAVRALVAMTHHPTLTAATTLAVALTAASVALITRRRPRTK